MKTIIREYFTAFRLHNWGRLWKFNYQTIIFVICWMLYWIVTGLFSEVKDAVMFAAVLIPIVYGYFDALIHPIRLDKQLYLCPMNKEERRILIRNTYRFRITFCMLLALLGTMILIVVSNFKPVSLAIILINDFLLFSEIVPRSNQVNGDWRQMAETVQQVFLITIAFLMNIIQLVTLSDTEPHTLLTIVTILVVLLIEIPIAVNYRKYVVEELEKAASYEEMEAEP